MSDNPIAMAGVGGPTGTTSGNGAGPGAPPGNAPSGGSAQRMGDLGKGEGGGLGQLDQLRSVIQATESLVGRVNLAVVRESDGAELWIDLLGSGASIPGHSVTIRLGEPPPGVYTNPATFFAQGLVTAAPLGVPIWVWGVGVGFFLFFVLPRLRGGKR